MKPEQHNRLGNRGFLDQPGEYGLQQPEIVWQMENPSLEAIRRLWWRAFDSVCYCMVFFRQSVHDRIFGPAADPNREADH